MEFMGSDLGAPLLFINMYFIGVADFFFFFFFFTLSFIFTSFREQDEAYINSLRWSALVGLEPAYTRM